jgi:hypothetical protein
MRLVLQIISFAALLATIAAPILFFATHLTLDQIKAAMLAATIVWFAATPFWMGHPKVEEELII